MSSDLEVSERVAREIYPIAVRQARERVLHQAFVIAAFVFLLALIGFPRDQMFQVGLFAIFVVATVYDLRWWLWVRRASPVEAFTRLQARTAHEGGSARSILTGVVAVAVLGLWWFFSR